MIWFWYFLFYSFVGFLLEVVFAWCARVHPRRKCLLILPLCPVYGFGCCCIVGATGDITSPPGLFLIGAIVATACEYVMAAFYEDILGVAFWNYDDMPLNIHGRVCLPFSLAWGLLSVMLVKYLHPAVTAISFSPPLAVTALMALAVGVDGLVSSALLLRNGTRDCLDWYGKKA